MKTVYLHGFGGTQVGPRAIDRGLQVEDPLFFDLPGFGATEDLQPHQMETWRDYATTVIDEINRHIGEQEQFQIVAHSHGSMVAYILAERYPDRIVNMVLLCPLSSGSTPGRLALKTVRSIVKVIGHDRSVVFMKKSVDLFTVVSWQPNWPKGALKSFIKQRREESKRYSVPMVQLLLKIPEFSKEFDATRVSVPATLVFAKGDMAVSRRDAEWYKNHIPSSRVIPHKPIGGHIMPDIHPHALSQLLRDHDALL